MPILTKIALVAAVAGIAAWLFSRRRDRDLDFAEAHTDHPERPIEEMERQADIPGGVRP